MFHETEWLRWGADIWKRNIEYCDVSNPTKVNSDLYAFCSRVVTVHDTCQQPGVSGQHKAFCDNAGLSPSKASRYIKVVADNWDGIKSCSSVYNVFKEGFALPAGGVPPWPKKPDRDKARPMNVKQMAINMEEVNSVAVITRLDLAAAAAEFGKKQKETYDTIKEKTELAERFLTMANEVRYSRLITILALGTPQQGLAECVRRYGGGGMDFDACVRSAQGNIALDIKALEQFTAYINDFDVMKCIHATERVKAVLKSN